MPVRLPAVHTSIRLTRAEFEESVRGPLLETVDMLLRVMDSANVRPEDLTSVLLVGGSSRIPLATRIISDRLGRPVAVNANPKYSVCQGAALVGARAGGLARSDAAQLVAAPTAVVEMASPPEAPPTTGEAAPRAEEAVLGPVPPEESAPPPRSDGSRRRAKLVVAAVAAAALGAAGIAALLRSGSKADGDGAGETTTSEADTTVETVPGTTGSAVTPAGLTIAAGQPVRVALLIPLGGESSELGVALQNAASLAAEDFGEVEGFEVEIVSIDDSCTDEAGGAEAASQVVASGDFVGVVGPSCSGAARGELPVLEEAGVAVVSGTATSPDLAPLAPTVFSRTVLNDEQLETAGLDVAHVENLASVQELNARYEERFGALPSAPIRPFVAYGYDALRIVLQRTNEVAAVEADGSLSVDTEALPTAIRGTSGFPGVTGAISFDSSGNRAA